MERELTLFLAELLMNELIAVRLQIAKDTNLSNEETGNLKSVKLIQSIQFRLSDFVSRVKLSK